MSAPESLNDDWLDKYHVDKLVHGVMYGLLAFLLLRDKLSILKVFIICTLYGIMMETIQGKFFEHRHFDILDIIANISGSLIGIGFYQFIKRKAYDK
jgi:VanZ family protein